jgi:hypothetical protein
MNTVMPMMELATRWRSSPLPRSWEFVGQCRAALLKAAATQIELKAEARIPYDPTRCPIFRWCSQWLDVADGKRHGIDPDVEFTFRMAMDPAPLSRKMLAANDILDL